MDDNRITADPGTPNEMLAEARVNLAFLQRFADRMAETNEGQVYLRLLNETAASAIDWAQTHCSRQVAA